MVATKNYNIHDILTVQVKTDNTGLLKGLNFPLTYFEVDDNIKNPDIILNIGKFTPLNNDCYLVDHKYHVKRNYFYCKDSDGKAKWEVEIEGFEKPPTIINFHGKVPRRYRILAPDMLPQDSILLPIIELFLGRKGFLLAHGGGIIKDGEAILFLGRSGSLKTTFIMNAVKHNYKILGDDRLTINVIDNQKANAFPIYPQILDYTLKNFKDENLNILKKFSLFKTLRKERLPISQVWQKEPVDLKSVFLLKRKSSGNNRMNINPIAKDIAIQKIIANNRAEIYDSSLTSILTKRNFMAYIHAYSFVFPDSTITKFWDIMKRRLGGMLNNIPVYELEVPQRYSSNLYEEFQSMIKEIK
jgi:hypothetical protein